MQRRYKIEYNQTGESNFYLPCDITHYTSKKYFTNSPITFPGLNNTIRIIGPSDHSTLGGMGYYQDGYIQLYDGTNYVNLCNLSIVNKSDFEKTKMKCLVPNCLLKNKRTGEIISSHNQGDTIPGLLFNHILDPVDGYKNIIVKSSELKDEFVTDEFIKIDSFAYKKEIEQSKGGNFISAPDGTIFYVQGPSPCLLDKIKLLTTKQLVELECGFKSGQENVGELYDNFRHVDEIMCFMPYGSQGYKIWFYDQFDALSFETLLKNKLTSEEKRSSNVEQIIQRKIDELNLERLRNLEKISMALFKKPYSECGDKFVFFKFYSYKPSIFNRVWFETDRKCICLFPDTETNEKLKYEMEKVKSIINPYIKVEHHFIQVKSANELVPEGTVHCLIKQRFVKTSKSIN